MVSSLFPQVLIQPIDPPTLQGPEGLGGICARGGKPLGMKPRTHPPSHPPPGWASWALPVPSLWACLTTGLRLRGKEPGLCVAVPNQPGHMPEQDGAASLIH